MKISICSAGTRGDVQPALALAVALVEAGHEVLFIAPPENKDWVEEYDVPFAGLSLSVRDMIDNLSGAMNLRNLIRFLKLLRKGIETQLRDFPALVAGSDLTIGISLVFALKTVAEYLDIPYIFLATSPQIIPSGEHPTIATKKQHLPSWVNRLDWWLAGKVNAWTWLGMVNRERRRLGMPKVKGSIWKHVLEPTPLVISDGEISTIPKDSPLECRQVGFLPFRQKGRIPDEVEEFLAAGSPPVYIGFGSIPTEAERTSRMLLEAARISGQRLILGSGWANLRDTDPGEDHLVVGNLPHEQLFPRLAAVIHHGGAGTTGTTLRAGVPQIIVPHYFDQFYWADRIHRAGLGPKGIYFDNLTSENLADAITKAVTVPNYAQRARELGETLAKKDSLGDTVRYIETLFGAK